MKKMCIYAVLVLLTLIALSPIVLGDSCNIRRVVYTQPPVRYTAPSHDLYYFEDGSYYKYPGHGYYGQLYYYEGGYYYPYKEKLVLVPKIVKVEVNRDHYYSIDSSYQQSLLADAIVGRLLRLQAEGKITTATPSGGRVPSGPATETSPTGNPGGSAAQEPKPGVYQNAALLAVINDSCAKCHGATSKYTRLVTADGKALNDLPAGKVWECFGRVNSGNMPKGGKALQDGPVKLFYEWADNAKR